MVSARIDGRRQRHGNAMTSVRIVDRFQDKNSRNPVFKKKLKHLPAELHYVRDQVKAKNIRVCKIASDDNPADALTKALGPAAFMKHMRRIMRPPPACFD